MQKQTIHQISIALIAPDPSNPRKFLRDQELESLAASIARYGVITPIMVRPDADGYRIVFGERRYRALCSLHKNLQTDDAKDITIPAIIADNLTDAQALELQITENLQRKDVHPMEEANAFHILAQNRGLPLSDIAARFGKSPKYVASRMVLIHLDANWQKVFYQDKITVSEALKLASCDMAYQFELWERCEKSGHNCVTGSLLPQFWRSDNPKLEDAPFDTRSSELIPERGACTDCQHNSSNTLFGYLEEKPVCRLAACFDEKKYRSTKHQVLLAKDGGLHFVHRNGYGRDFMRNMDIAKEHAVAVLDPDECFETVFMPEEVAKPEENAPYILVMAWEHNMDTLSKAYAENRVKRVAIVTDRGIVEGEAIVKANADEANAKTRQKIIRLKEDAEKERAKAVKKYRSALSALSATDNYFLGGHILHIHELRLSVHMLIRGLNAQCSRSFCEKFGFEIDYGKGGLGSPDVRNWLAKADYETLESAQRTIIRLMLRDLFIAHPFFPHSNDGLDTYGLQLMTTIGGKNADEVAAAFREYSAKIASINANLNGNIAHLEKSLS